MRLLDLRFACFAFAAVLTLGLGIGAGTGVFPVLKRRFAKPPAQVAIARSFTSSWMDYIDFRRGSGDVLEDLWCHAFHPLDPSAL